MPSDSASISAESATRGVASRVRSPKGGFEGWLDAENRHQMLGDQARRESANLCIRIAGRSKNFARIGIGARPAKAESA